MSFHMWGGFPASPAPHGCSVFLLSGVTKQVYMVDLYIAELIETGEIFFKEPYITNPVSLSGRISVCFPLVSVWIAYGCSEMGSLFQGITFF